ncbi:hypothetical protein OIU77_000604 [Salix suchowensis]|uniref:HPP transmembrane region domain-containing protein n=1 Tax=Salix suchowensis TaxID=1278906 RepID=A0ABQ9B9U2_9ROSI|nr:hypothetical protein OIU77_000604 [Salix suchowensis]
MKPTITAASNRLLEKRRDRKMLFCDQFKCEGGSDSVQLKKWECSSKITAKSSNVSAPLWDSWKPDNSPASTPFSDIIWPSAGAFEPFSALLFVTPSSPGARKYNMFMAQIGCAAIGVFAFSVFGPGWLARSVALAASIAFMVYTRSTHPSAASLPLLFIDGAKFHHLHLWYALFPGATGCIILCLIQEIVCYLKDSVKF